MSDIAASEPPSNTGDHWRAETDALLRRIAPRGKSLIMTVYGDSIQPHGGGAWLGDLIELLKPLGMNERVIRTSVYRLVQDDLLAARQVGRRSFYDLTQNGARRTLEASRRIYALRPPAWDGTWTQVWLPETDNHGQPGTLEQELGRLGFASLTPDIMLHLDEARDLAAETIGRLGLSAQTIIMSTRPEGPWNAAAAIRAHVERIWPLDAMAVEYAAFLGLAEPVRDMLATGDRPDGATCFLLRSLLVHAYRRIVLKDPLLPRDLLADEWPGIAASEIMRDLHGLIAGPAQAHVMRHLHGLDGPFAPPDASFETRFQPANGF